MPGMLNVLLKCNRREEIWNWNTFKDFACQKILRLRSLPAKQPHEHPGLNKGVQGDSCEATSNSFWAMILWLCDLAFTALAQKT